MSLHTVIWGKGAPLIACLHGLGDCALAWAHVARRISHCGTVVACDLPGHGSSARDPLGRYSPRGMVGPVEATLDQFDAPKCVLIGHSLGAQIAIHLAAESGRQIAALVLVEGGPFAAPGATAEILRTLLDRPRVYATREEYERWLSESLQLADPRDLSVLAEGMLTERDDGALELRADPHLMEAMSFTPDAELAEQARAIECPCLVVRGAWSSVLSDSAAKDIAALFRKGQMRRLPGAGHAAPVENPHGLAGLIDIFLRQAVAP